jgi:hypothetical protein
MENISNALKAFRGLGLKEYEMFSTIDLSEEKNLEQCAVCIHALGRLMQSTAYEACGLPKLGVKVWLPRRPARHPSCALHARPLCLHLLRRRSWRRQSATSPRRSWRRRGALCQCSTSAGALD